MTDILSVGKKRGGAADPLRTAAEQRARQTQPSHQVPFWDHRVRREKEDVGFTRHLDFKSQTKLFLSPGSRKSLRNESNESRGKGCYLASDRTNTHQTQSLS